MAFSASCEFILRMGSDHRWLCCQGAEARPWGQDGSEAVPRLGHAPTALQEQLVGACRLVGLYADQPDHVRKHLSMPGGR